MAHQILEANRGAEGLVLMGIPTRGVALAHRLAAVMDEVEGVRVPVGSLDVTMYRDDLRRQPTRAVGHTHLPVEVDDSTVVLVDDVLYSGRTVRAALDALGDLGRPRVVRLAVLVDRGHRELPIRADYAGRVITTTRDEIVQVLLREQDGEDRVVLLDRQRSSDATVRPVRAGKASRPRPGRRPADPGPARRPAKRPGRPEPPAGRRRR